MAERGGQTRVAKARTAIERLERWMPREVREVVTTLAARQGARGVLVGGGVRDAFLGREPPDWDVATDAPPARVADWFPRVARTGEQHGTIMVLTRGVPVEVTTFRGEGPYLDGRRPSHVVFLEDLEADLARRDLTINAIAYDVIAGRLVDPFGGEDDLRRGVVRAVGDAAQRFDEDGLRPLRAVRFAATLGFDVEPATAAALATKTFERVAWERKRVEMEKLLANGVAFAKPLGLLHESGMLHQMSPELDAAPGVFAKADVVFLRVPRDAWLRFATWCFIAGVRAPVAGEIALRLRSSKSDARRVDDALMAVDGLSKVPPSGAELRAWVSASSWPAAHDASRIMSSVHADTFARFPAQLTRLEASRPPLAIADLAIDGAVLGELGMRGPMVGQVLRGLLREVVKNPKINTRASLLEMASVLSTAKSHT